MENYDETYENAIAIVSMAGRFPEAKTIEEFWQNLYDGKESVKFFNRDELIKMGIDKHLLDNPKFVAADAVLSDIDKFDASFFDYSAREAEITDPQHRLFLEAAWEALEKAGYTSDKYNGRVAVYAGANLSGYMIRNLNTNPGLAEQLGSFKIMISNGQDFLATKVSHKMNLKGPSVNVNTLCSSSMVALHYACKSLLDYDSDLALAGAVSIQISRNEAFFYQEGGIGSSDGHVRAFDSKANGTVSGSGLGIVVLKRLEDAIAEGDNIEAVIRGTGINNDGAIKNSYTAPSVDGQAECIAEALEMSGVNPETISYIDAHGTGTNLGDPIEIAALTKAYRAYTQKKQFCAIGSVKTNIGHLVHAGGIASLIKTVLSIQHKTIPASLNFEEPNPKIDFANTPFYINNKRKSWQSEEPLRAAVSSFGIGGTNTHVILEEAPKKEDFAPSNRGEKLIMFSAKTASALETMNDNLKEFLINHPDTDLDDLAFTLALGRKDFAHKRAVTAKSANELISLLEDKTAQNVITTFKKECELKPIFVFTDKFSSLKGVSEIYNSEPDFKAAFDDCTKAIAEITDIRDCVLNNNPCANNTFVLASFAVEFALASLLKKWGVCPEKIYFKAKGVVAALAFAEALSIGDAVKLLNGEEVSFNQTVMQIFSITGEKLRLTLNDVKAAMNEDFQKESLDGEFNSTDTIVFTFEKESENLLSLLPQNNDSFENHLLMCLAHFWAEGGKIDYNGYYANEKRHRIVLPTYPFEHQSYWIEPGNRNDSSDESVKKLAKRERPELETPYIAPVGETEKKIAEICEDILGYDKVGMNDDFFELGGHSLLAVAFIARLRKEFKKDITLENLFENTTVAKIVPFFSDNPEDFDEGTL